MIKKESPEEWRPGVDLQEPELIIVKEEEEEPWTSLEGRQLDVKEEADATKFSFTTVSLKSDYDEKPLLSPLLQHQMEDGDLSTSSSADQMEATTGEADSGGGETTRNPSLNSHLDDSSSSETEVSDCCEDEEDENHSDSGLKGLSDFEPIPEDSDEDWKESKSPELGVNKSFSCSECGKQFLHVQSLQKHMSSHSGVKASSSLVKKSFDVESQQRLQVAQKSFSCDDCDENFTRKTDLNTHKRIHTGQKTFVCDVCERRFSYKSRLDAHTRIHTGDQPFVCDVCGQRCSGKAHLNRHMRIHTGQKPFTCDFCERKFSQRGSLNIHIRIHTGQKPFACDVCERQFSQRTDLNRHARIHTGDKPFACRVCGRQFNQKGNLNTHMKTHTENKALVCNDS
ncbi:zinc finger protein OZF isoform X1 [Austrofundulus limnaeus]|uniref:Zinc finger protein OZF isoform X1 n=1 Tax=Austrofundulus limnaeus TaxID=52670 RepID=A0A2I4CQS8_AUSLI|nr:PREDICTED: zinc finger protein OZF-like isoform X1 [Austrofundulus limnaeus]